MSVHSKMPKDKNNSCILLYVSFANERRREREIGRNNTVTVKTTTTTKMMMMVVVVVAMTTTTMMEKISRNVRTKYQYIYIQMENENGIYGTRKRKVL